jgi:hypothetical protein
MAVIEFANMETQRALEQYSPHYHAQTAPVQRLPNLPAKIAYQKVVNGKPVITIITKE